VREAEVSTGQSTKHVRTKGILASHRFVVKFNRFLELAGTVKILVYTLFPNVNHEAVDIASAVIDY
jgi:hypothetical protein